MAKKEVSTDLWVHDLLKEAGIELDAQGSSIKDRRGFKISFKAGNWKSRFS